MELTWKASETATALYAAVCLAERQPVVEVRLAETYALAVGLALGEFLACGVSGGPMLATLAALAASGVEDNRQLVEQALVKMVGAAGSGNQFVGRMAAAISGLKAAFQNAYRATVPPDSPELIDELLARGQPIVEQWESHGSGVLAQVARLTEGTVIAERANVVLVYPLLGGNGVAHRAVNTVTFEAVLANPDAEPPETLRLAWLIAQLNLDLPKYADLVSAEHRESVGRLAIVPAVLAAGELDESAALSPESIAQALAVWRLAHLAATPHMLANWWNTYQAGAMPWAVALAALEQMLFRERDRS